MIITRSFINKCQQCLCHFGVTWNAILYSPLDTVLVLMFLDLITNYYEAEST